MSAPDATDARTCDRCGATFAPDAATIHDWDDADNEHCPDCGRIVRGPARRDR